MHSFSQARNVARADVRRRIMILDDHIFFAACLRVLLDNESDMVVCDILPNSDELPEKIERLKPDLLVIDLSLGTENGIEVGQRLRQQTIATPILFVSSMAAPSSEQLEGIAHSAFIPKSKTPADFLAALRALLASVAVAVDSPAVPLTLRRASLNITPNPL